MTQWEGTPNPIVWVTSLPSWVLRTICVTLAVVTVVYFAMEFNTLSTGLKLLLPPGAAFEAWCGLHGLIRRRSTTP